MENAIRQNLKRVEHHRGLAVGIKGGLGTGKGRCNPDSDEVCDSSYSVGVVGSAIEVYIPGSVGIVVWKGRCNPDPVSGHCSTVQFQKAKDLHSQLPYLLLISRWVLFLDV
ncbi:uncharacterized protein LOC112323677 isoform X3 [Populus trichocarpa]|uniref:Uncharacterized protein n=1 Tax=Populus trichocarpa TaxID=3694 RepID=A0A3N7HC66_POPTR|nr:uncharacterized protein LOC112323677 isoform X3 [Populus trichocarpa]|eukprot:XP_024438643.1 uncharacterized protein LOC112323677 isoform X3 [Populus trichocarpa]